MTLTCRKRAERCEEAISSYLDDEPYTNLIDWLADAMHWCHQSRHDMAHALELALMHFDAELSQEAGV